MSETNKKVRPKNFDEMIGQTKLKQVFKIMMASAKARKTAMGHTLIFGKSGSGKTTIAYCLAAEMGTKLSYANAASLKEPSNVIPFFSRVQTGDILFIDEIHRLSNQMAEWFYTIMEDFHFFLPNGEKKELPHFTIVGATTHIGDLNEPFKNRFKFTTELQDYTEKDLKDMAKFMISREDFPLSPNNQLSLSDETISILVNSCRDTPRILLSQIEFVRDFFVMKNTTKINRKKLIGLLKLMGFESNGLTKTDMKYLSAINSLNGTSLKQIASKIDLDERTITTSIEPFLIKRKLIDITNKGRFLAVDTGKIGDSLMESDLEL